MALLSFEMSQSIQSVWLTLQKCDDFIYTPLREEQLGSCLELHKKFLEAGERKQSEATGR
jgi:hypothetical protein